MRNIMWVMAGALCVAAVATGCGSSSSSGGTTAAPKGTGGSNTGGSGGAGGGGGSAAEVTADQACQDYATASCSQLAACSLETSESEFPDMATCVTRFQGSCSQLLALNGVAYTPESLDACAKVVMTASCADVFSFILSGQTPPGCDLPAGTLADGTQCQAGAQCAHFTCKTPAGMSCGTCAPAGTLGGACDNSRDCPFGNVCIGAVCVVPGAAGATCDATHPCALGLPCVAGACTTPTPDGMACTPAAKPDACDVLNGGFCNPMTMLCQKVKYAAAGEACGIVGSDLVQCSGAGTCTGLSMTVTMGTCVAAAADGAACNTKTGPSCLLPAACVAGTCQTTVACPSGG